MKQAAGSEVTFNYSVDQARLRSSEVLVFVGAGEKIRRRRVAACQGFWHGFAGDAVVVEGEGVRYKYFVLSYVCPCVEDGYRLFVCCFGMIEGNVMSRQVKGLNRYSREGEI